MTPPQAQKAGIDFEEVKRLAVEALRLAEVAAAEPWELIFDRAPAKNFSTGEPQGTAPNWRSLRVVDGENRLLLRIAADPEQVLKAEDMDFIARARTLLPELARALLATHEGEARLHREMETLADEWEGTDHWPCAIELRARWSAALTPESPPVEAEEGA